MVKKKSHGFRSGLSSVKLWTVVMDWQAKSDEEKNSAWHLSITRSGSVRLNSGSRMYSVFVEIFGMGQEGRWASFPATWGEIVLQMDHSCGTSLYSHSENTFRPSRRFWFISQQNVSHHTIYDKIVYLPFSMYLFLFWRPALSVVLLFSWKTYILSLMCFLSCNFLGLHVILLLNVI